MTSRVLLRTQGSAVLDFGAIWTRVTFRINKLQSSSSPKRHASHIKIIFMFVVQVLAGLIANMRWSADLNA